MKNNNIFKLIICIAIPLAVGATAGAFTASGVQGWYAVANKPSFNPPNWIFAPMWTLLYLLMGIALYFIVTSTEKKTAKKNAIIIFGIQLTLNFFWSFIFFKMQQPGWAFAEILLMWLAILFTIFAFAKISKKAAWLMVPYICWVSFAAILNFAIYTLN
jgi:translocator protein